MRCRSVVVEYRKSREIPAWRARPRKVTGWPVRATTPTPRTARDPADYLAD